MDRLLDVHEMAALLGVKPSWLYQHTCRGAIPHIKVGRYVRFDPQQVIAFLKEQQTTTELRRDLHGTSV